MELPQNPSIETLRYSLNRKRWTFLYSGGQELRVNYFVVYRRILVRDFTKLILSKSYSLQHEG